MTVEIAKEIAAGTATHALPLLAERRPDGPSPINNPIEEQRSAVPSCPSRSPRICLKSGIRAINAPTTNPFVTNATVTAVLALLTNYQIRNLATRLESLSLRKVQHIG